MGKLKRIFKFFYQENYDIQHRLLNIILLSGLIGIFISSIVSAFLGFKLITLVITGFSFISFLISLWIANGLKKPQAAVVFLSILANNIILPAMFVLSGGMQSGMPVWSLMGLLVSVMLIRGKKAYVVFVLNLLGFISAIIFSYFHPDSLIYLESIRDIYIDLIVGVILVSGIFTLIFKYQSYIYEKQKKEILNAYKTAQKATDAKTEFLSNISHDVRTPLNAIVGYTELAQKSFEDQDKLKDYISKISIASNHLLNLVSEVLDMSKIEKGMVFKVEEVVCKISDVIEDVLHLLQKEISDKQLKVHVEYSLLDDGVVSCDKVHVNQILINLIGNAVKYSGPEKNIYINVIQFTAEDDSKTLFEFHIKDEGCGINAEYLDKIFLPFVRERRVENSSVPGSGLGLAISKSLAEMLGGSISVKSEENVGSEFVVSLPIPVPSLTEVVDDEESLDYDFKGKRILVVDDDDMSREIFSASLRSTGADVIEAQDGSFAIERITLSNPGFYDLILMDLHMPAIDGFEATKIIRNLETKELSDIPIIAVTANAFPEDKKKAFESGMNAYLVKPVKINDLEKVLKLILHDH